MDQAKSRFLFRVVGVAEDERDIDLAVSQRPRTFARVKVDLAQLDSRVRSG